MPDRYLEPVPRLLFTAIEAAQMLAMNDKYFRKEVNDGHIPYRMVGPNSTLQRFGLDDLRAYMEERRCGWGSTDEKTAPSGGAPSSSTDVGFEEALVLTTNKPPKAAPQKLNLKPEKRLKLVPSTN